MTTYDAIIPAGGEIDPVFAQAVGTTSKAMIPFEGVPTLIRIIDALRESGVIRRIAVIGPEPVLRLVDGKADLILSQGPSGPDNIMRGLDALAECDSPPDRVVVVTSDLPFLTAEVVSQFISICPEADITLPLVTQREYVTRFPGSDATFVTLSDGTWTAGCMYLLNVKALRAAKPHIDRIFAARKSKLGMAKLLGPGFLVKFLTKRLTVGDIERKITSMLHCSGKAVHGSPPELAFDIDYLDDYEYAVRHLQGVENPPEVTETSSR